MTDNSTRRPIRLRTFASDLEAKRGTGATLDPSIQPVVSAALAEEALAKPTPRQRASTPEPTDINITASSSVKINEDLSVPSPSTTIERPAAPAEASTTINKIPAFHELKKKANTIHTDITAETPKHKKKKPARKASAAPDRPNVGYDSAIITDTKSERFKLFPSIIDSLRSWFTQLTKNRARRKVPQYSVPETERRKGVIQRATSKTGTIFSADSETLREQIRRRQQRAEETDTDDELDTIWTPFTETGFPLLEAPDEPVPTIQNVTIEYKRRPQIVVPTNETPVIPPEAMAADATNELEVIEPLSEDEARWAATAAEDRSDLLEAEIPPEPFERTVVAESTEPFTQTVPLAKRSTTQTRFLSLSDTNTLTIIVVIAIVAVVVTVFVGYTIFFKDRSSEAALTVSLTEPVLSPATLNNLTLTAQSLNTVPELINSTLASSSAGLVELALVSATGEEISPAYLFEILRFQTMPGLRQALTSVRFASVNGSDPIIVLSFTDTDTVRGGLLAWENTITADLIDLYDLPVLPASAFTDETISGVDTRILRHENKTVLMYGIVGENIALITTNFADFAQVIDLLGTK